MQTTSLTNVLIDVISLILTGFVNSLIIPMFNAIASLFGFGV